MWRWGVIPLYISTGERKFSVEWSVTKYPNGSMLLVIFLEVDKVEGYLELSWGMLAIEKVRVFRESKATSITV